MKEPKDLGIKIGTPDEVLWNAVQKNARKTIEEAENSIKVNKEILLIAAKKIAEEKRKIKT